MITAKYPKSSRLLSKKDFEEMKTGSVRHQSRLFLAFTKCNNRTFSRLGLSVHRSAGHSPQRNRLKRLTRELFRKSPIHFHFVGKDILIVFKNPLIDEKLLGPVLDKFFTELIS